MTVLVVPQKLLNSQLRGILNFKFNEDNEVIKSQKDFPEARQETKPSNVRTFNSIGI